MWEVNNDRPTTIMHLIETGTVYQEAWNLHFVLLAVHGNVVIEKGGSVGFLQIYLDSVTQYSV